MLSNLKASPIPSEGGEPEEKHYRAFTLYILKNPCSSAERYQFINY
jgi:hypothetical protein